MRLTQRSTANKQATANGMGGGGWGGQFGLCYAKRRVGCCRIPTLCSWAASSQRAASPA